MKRADDFAERRKHLASLSDQELYERFWSLTEQVVDPLLELGRKIQVLPSNGPSFFGWASPLWKPSPSFRAAWTGD
jgi:hypothetical protein